jgi:hypothetical protein
MRNVLLLIGFMVSFCFAQDSIPYPPAIPTGYSVYWVESVGDYDGDGSADVAMLLTGPGNPVYICIYSYAKGSYLLQASTSYSERTKFSFGDINNDGKIEVIACNVIYKYSSSMSKKKAF